MAGLLAFGGDFAQELEIGAVAVQEVLFAAGQELGGQEAGQEVQGYAGLDHGEEFVVQIDQFVEGVLGGVQGFLQLFIFFVEDVGQGA